MAVSVAQAQKDLDKHFALHRDLLGRVPEIMQDPESEEESISSFIVVPGFGSRKRVADTLGSPPEQLAAVFDGNLAILHFDK